jgi:hypothetical protein
MSRDGGFTRADVDTGMLDDPKFRKLGQLHPDLFVSSVVAYLAVLLASWRAGNRAALDEAWPLLLAADPAVADALREVRLLDARQRIPARVWRSWFQPAFERREKRRENASAGGRAAHGLPRKPPGANGATVEQQSTDSRPDRSHPTGPYQQEFGRATADGEGLADVV